MMPEHIPEHKQTMSDIMDRERWSYEQGRPVDISVGSSIGYQRYLDDKRRAATPSGGSAGFLLNSTACVIGGFAAVYASDAGWSLPAVVGVFFGAVVLAVAALDGLHRLLTWPALWAVAGVAGLCWLIIWIRDFVANYATYAFPYNWVAGWYFYLFYGIKVSGKILVGLVAWPWMWKLAPFAKDGWNTTLCVALSLGSVTGIYFAGRMIRHYLDEWNLTKKLGIACLALAFGPAATGIMWKLGSLLWHWMRSP